MGRERMTAISLPGTSHWIGGFAEWGEVSRDAMIAAHRMRAKKALQDAQAVLDAADEDFHIATYRGVHVQRDYKVIQQGKPQP